MTTLLKNILNEKKIAYCQFENNLLTDYNQIFLDFCKLKQSPSGYTLRDIFETLQEKGIINFYTQFEEKLKLIANTPKHEQELIITEEHTIIQMEVFAENEQKIITFEDITEAQKMKQERKIQANNIIRLIDNFPEACFIIGSNGNLESYNNLFISLTNLNIDKANENPHINHIFEETIIFANIEELEQLKQYILRMQNFIFNSTLKNKQQIYIKGIQLENNKLLVFFEKETEGTQVSEANLNKGFKNMQKELFFDFEAIIKAPLQNIINFNNLVLGGYVGEINKRQKEYLKKIEHDAKLLAERLEYKIQKNIVDENHNIKKEKIETNELLARIIMHLTQKIKEKDITLELKVDWYEIFSSKKLLEKILYIIIEHFISQNEKGSIMIWEVKKIDNSPVIIVKDTCKKAIFNNKTVEERPDLQMVFNIMKLLKINHKSYIKGRKFREFYMFF